MGFKIDSMMSGRAQPRPIERTFYDEDGGEAFAIVFLVRPMSRQFQARYNDLVGRRGFRQRKASAQLDQYIRVGAAEVVAGWHAAGDPGDPGLELDGKPFPYSEKNAFRWFRTDLGYMVFQELMAEANDYTAWLAQEDERDVEDLELGSAGPSSGAGAAGS